MENGSFELGTGQVLVWFVSLSGQLHLGRLRVKLRFGSLTSTMFRSVQVRFEWNSANVYFVLSTVARFRSGMGQVQFESGGVQFNVWANTGSEANGIGYESSWVHIESLYILNVAIFSSLLQNCI